MIRGYAVLGIGLFVGCTLFVGCNLVADLDGYVVVPNAATGAGGTGATGGMATTNTGGSGGIGAQGGGGAGGSGGEPMLPCGSTCTGDHVWTTAFTGVGGEWVNALIADPTDDSVYVGGGFSNDMTIGATTYVAPSSRTDLFIAKLDAAGELDWSFATQTTYHERLRDLTLDGGDLIAVGDFEQTTDIGGIALSASNTFDLLIFKLDPLDGSVVWAFNHGGAGNVRGNALTSHVDGGFVVVGEFSSTFDLGGGVLPSFGGTDVFMAHFDTEGAYQWSQSVGGTANEDVTAVERTPDGGFVVLGTTNGVVDLGGGELPYVGEVDIFIAKFDKFAVHQWSQTYGGSKTDLAHDLAVDAAGRIYVAGDFNETIAFGGDTLTAEGDVDAFVAVFDQAGSHVFSARYGDTSYQSARAITDDTFGNILMGGTFSGAIDIGGGPLSSGGDDEDIFVGKIGLDGTYRYGSAFGNPGADDQRVDGVAVTSDGSGVFAGTYDGSVNFGGGPINASAANDVFVFKLSK